MTELKEMRRLYSDDLRRLCIRNNWYTRGDSEEYSRLLALAEKYKNVKTATIVNLAEDILEHSDTEYQLSSICFEIAEIPRPVADHARRGGVSDWRGGVSLCRSCDLVGDYYEI